jgi:hypothetical protein
MNDITEEIWPTLSVQNVNDHTDKKGQFTYLAWTWAWAAVKKFYPTASYELDPDVVYSDGTMEVRTRVKIGHLELPMWLPVTNHQNKAIPNPNAYDVNTARMRCLVKNIAMFGLGHYIYAGESLPQEAKATKAQWEKLMDIMQRKAAIELRVFSDDVGADIMTDLFNMAEKGKKTQFKEDVRKLYRESHEIITGYAKEISSCLSGDDEDGAKQLIDELSEGERFYVRASLPSQETPLFDKLVGG